MASENQKVQKEAVLWHFHAVLDDHCLYGVREAVIMTTYRNGHLKESKRELPIR